MSRRVGVVGLGLIGSAACRRLLDADMGVQGIDLDPSKMAALEAIGGTRAAGLRDLLGLDAIVLAVFDTTQVEQAVAALQPAQRQPVICLSTCDPERIAALIPRAAEGGLDLIEMPLSGSSGQLAAGEALGLVSGADAGAVLDILAAICPRRFVLPRPGDGARVKLAINLILGLNRAALAEGLAFAERLGLDLPAFLGIARASAAFSQIMDVKGERMISGDFSPQGRVMQSAKDFALIREAAERTGAAALPLATVYAALMAGCIEAGEGERDNAAVIAEIRRRAWPDPSGSATV